MSIIGPRPLLVSYLPFDKDNIETVRYSFSTKIIDCLQSGNQVLGIFNVLLSLLGKVTDNYSVLFAIVAVLFTITVCLR